MSHQFIHDEFPVGSVNSSGEVDVGGCLAQDVVASRIQELLRADATLSALLNGVFRFDVPPEGIESWADYPFITIANSSIDPTIAPTNLVLNQIETNIAIWHQFRDVDALEPYEPSITSLQSHVEAVLASQVMLPITLQAGSTPLQIATNGVPVARFNDTFSSQDRYVGVRELTWQNAVSVSASTGKVKEIELAGG